MLLEFMIFNDFLFVICLSLCTKNKRCNTRKFSAFCHRIAQNDANGLYSGIDLAVYCIGRLASAAKLAAWAVHKAEAQFPSNLGYLICHGFWSKIWPI